MTQHNTRGKSMCSERPVTMMKRKQKKRHFSSGEPSHQTKNRVPCIPEERKPQRKRSWFHPQKWAGAGDWPEGLHKRGALLQPPHVRGVGGGGRAAGQRLALAAGQQRGQRQHRRHGHTTGHGHTATWRAMVCAPGCVGMEGVGKVVSQRGRECAWPSWQCD